MTEKLLYNPLTLSIMPTRQCTAQCLDCGTESSPYTKERLQLVDILAAIDVAADEGFKVVVFTGGEATLRWPDLIKGISRAYLKGLKTRLVTNGWWGRSSPLAKTKMKALYDAGLDEINFSTGDEHSIYIPVVSLCNAVAAALDIGYDPSVMIEIHADSTLTKNSLLKFEAFKAAVGDRTARVRFVESPWMPLKADQRSNYPAGLLANSHNIGDRLGCDSIFSTHTIQPTGMVSICCGLGISELKQLHCGEFDAQDTSFRTIAAEAEADTVKILIRELGPERILQRTSIYNDKIKWENMYAHKCQACIRVFSDSAVLNTIADHEDELLLEAIGSLVLNRLMEFSAVSSPIDAKPDH